MVGHYCSATTCHSIIKKVEAVVWSLYQEAEKFVLEGNPIKSTAKEMLDYMRQLAECTRGYGYIEVYILNSGKTRTRSIGSQLKR